MMQKLFDEVGFVDEYRNEMEYFYSSYFDTHKELELFFYNVFQNDGMDMVPRRMMNQIQRFVTLANDIDKLRPGRDPLRILFLRICLESLAKLSQKRNNEFFDTFLELMPEEGRKYISSHFHLVYCQNLITGERFDDIYDLTISDFLELIRVVRNMVVHEGNYWEIQLFARDDSEWITSIETDEKILKSIHRSTDKKQLTSYSFETTLNYDKFMHYFVTTCIKFVQEYINERT